jgi:hypothetical protein
MEDTHFDLTKEMERDILRRFISYILNRLVLDGMIDKDKAHDPEYLEKLVLKNTYILDEPSFSRIIEIHHEFCASARKMIDDNKPIVAIVLLCTAIEQILNLYYRYFLTFQGISDEDITKIIKRNNFDIKTGWLMTLVVGREFPPDLKKRISEIVEIRNSIVHYKAVPGPFDSDDDSYSRIEERIKKLDYTTILSIPNELERTLEKIFEESSQEYKMTKELSKILFTHLKI